MSGATMQSIPQNRASAVCDSSLLRLARHAPDATLATADPFLNTY